MITVRDNIPQFLSVLERYIKLRGKSDEDSLAHRTRELSMELWKQFRRIRPEPSSIASAAAARRYTFGRSQSGTLAKVHSTGVSVAAHARAEKLLGDAKSDYFRVLMVNGVPTVRRARVGIRNARKLLRGGRFGNKFAPSSRGLRGVSNEQVAALKERHPELKRLNLQALAAAMEIAYRARAAAGGTLSLQFLHQVYRKRKSATVKTGPLISRTRGGVPIGEVTFNRGPEGKISETHIIGKVPGTAKVDAKHAIVSTALTEQIADMTRYILDKEAKNAKAAGFK